MNLPLPFLAGLGAVLLIQYLLFTAVNSLQRSPEDDDAPPSLHLRGGPPNSHDELNFEKTLSKYAVAVATNTTDELKTILIATKNGIEAIKSQNEALEKRMNDMMEGKLTTMWSKMKNEIQSELLKRDASPEYPSTKLEQPQPHDMLESENSIQDISARDSLQEQSEEHSVVSTLNEDAEHELDINKNLPSKSTLDRHLSLRYDANTAKMNEIMSKFHNDRVPTVMHFTWVDMAWDRPLEQAPIPAEVMATVDDWQHLHPDWHVIIWTNASVLLHFPEIYKTLSSIQVGAWASDLMRYHILKEFGGVYLDTDIVPLRPIPASTMESPFAVCEYPRSYNPADSKCVIACNAVIASPRENEDIQLVADNAMQRTKQNLKRSRGEVYKLEWAGSPALSEAVLDEKSSFKILQSHSFYPCNYDQKEDCIPDRYRNDTEVIAMHLWSQSWAAQSIRMNESGLR